MMTFDYDHRPALCVGDVRVDYGATLAVQILHASRGSGSVRRRSSAEIHIVAAIPEAEHDFLPKGPPGCIEYERRMGRKDMSDNESRANRWRGQVDEIAESAYKAVAAVIVHPHHLRTRQSNRGQLNVGVLDHCQCQRTLEPEVRRLELDFVKSRGYGDIFVTEPFEICGREALIHSILQGLAIGGIWRKRFRKVLKEGKIQCCRKRQLGLNEIRV